MTKKLLITLCLSVGLLITGCSFIPKAYRLDIPQGNVITQEKVTQVKIGMNRRQVQNILGSPLLVDTFNQDRWDYFYSVNTQDGTTIEHHITLVFKNNLVTQIIDND